MGERQEEVIFCLDLEGEYISANGEGILILGSDAQEGRMQHFGAKQ